MDQSSNDELERRKFFRLDMEKELIDISWTNATGQTQQKKIACLDFSRGGLRLDCDQAIPINTQVTVIFKAASDKNQTLSGKVLRCVKQKSGWFEVALILDDAN
ncbi:PilZ domain-containing protein [Colwellia sp. RSH04]|uniref:PilZ domain-containing protein n=1 Tax=Colwellia sp. RSH04 TaxID=2305464 RepID=UPI000E5727FB|nr:PilZ domain-containing protein [Colwellia sp. RSH04]RHW76388.1 PilZ domain-containing protein [Colwellia sp. RSH04]